MKHPREKTPGDTHCGMSDASVSSYADSLAREAAVLQHCRIIDFDVLEYKGGGCNGAVFLARCNNRNNPFWAWKVYAIKMVYNYGGLTSAGLTSRFQGEFMRFDGLKAARAAHATAGHKNGLVSYHSVFTDRIPESIVELLKPVLSPEVLLLSTRNVSG